MPEMDSVISLMSMWITIILFSIQCHFFRQLKQYRSTGGVSEIATSTNEAYVTFKQRSDSAPNAAGGMYCEVHVDPQSHPVLLNTSPETAAETEYEIIPAEK